MKRKAKALVSEYKNELLAARTLYVSLDRADNVIEGRRIVPGGRKTCALKDQMQMQRLAH